MVILLMILNCANDVLILMSWMVENMDFFYERISL